MTQAVATSPENEQATDLPLPRHERGGRGKPTAAERRREEAMLARYAETREPGLREELAERFMPLARSLAMRYRHGSEPLEDLVQVASLGLMKAIEGYEPGRGRRFTSYAVPTILGELRRHFRDRVWNLHLPRALQERTMEVNEAIQKLGDSEGRTPSVRRIAEYLEVDEDEVLEALQADEARRTLSLDAPRSREDEEAAPTIETVGEDDLGYEAVEAQLAAADADLDEREEFVLRRRFGHDLSQSEIGKELGVSQMQVSRIMRRGLKKLLGAVREEDAAA
jgi:RNA polymerase sigma-B factor